MVVFLFLGVLVTSQPPQMVLIGHWLPLGHCNQSEELLMAMVFGLRLGRISSTHRRTGFHGYRNILPMKIFTSSWV